MSRENIEALTKTYEALADGDVDTVLASYSTDTVWDDRKLRPEGAIHRGRDAMQTEMDAWFATWDNYTWTVEEMVDADDRVVAIGRERGVAKQSGVEIYHQVALVHTFCDGLIVETTVYGDPGEALKAVGLSRA
jgi:ketosteroid isomerase-like protein